MNLLPFEQQLVMFVRKRDKRVLAHRKQLDEINDQNRKKSKENRAQQLSARQKELENFTENEWMSMAQLEKDLKEMESNYDQEAKTKKKGKKKNRKGYDDSIGGAEGGEDNDQMITEENGHNITQ